MSSTGYDDPLEALRAMMHATELHTEVTREAITLLKTHGATLREHERRLDELEESVASMMIELGRITRRARLLVNMKAATLTSTCLRCGNDYASEAGPQLCGHCWVELGKPERYLAPAEPA